MEEVIGILILVLLAIGIIGILFGNPLPAIFMMLFA